MGVQIVQVEKHRQTTISPQILERDEIQRLKIAIDSRLKLLNKYLPDAKIELETSDGRTVNPVEMLINFVPDLRTNEEIITND